MERVIGEYLTEDAATSAVRALERDHHLSIQDMVVADRTRRTWRKWRPEGGGTFANDARFLVVMRGGPHEIARARALLN